MSAKTTRLRLSGQQIYDALKKSGPRKTRKAFVDVYSIDNVNYGKIKRHMRRHAKTCLILNTTRAAKPGEHWVAVCFDNKERECYYFDSYGLGPHLLPQTLRLVTELVDNSCYSTKMLQDIEDPTSQACGFYCIAFVRLFCSPLVSGHQNTNIIRRYHKLFKGVRDKDKKAVELAMNSWLCV